MKRIRSPLVTGSAAVFFLMTSMWAGCSGGEDPPLTSHTGAITITLSPSGLKTIWPAEWAGSIGTYEVVLHGEGGVVDTWGPGNPEGDTITFQDVEYGSYGVSVQGICLDGLALCSVDGLPLPIAAGGADDIVLGAPSVSVTVDVWPLIGEAHAGVTGWVDLTLGWPDSQHVSRVEVDHKTVDAEEWSEAFDVEAFDLDLGMVWATLTDRLVLENGAHLFRLRLFDGVSLVATAIDVVNVYGNFRTVGTVLLTDDDFMSPSEEPGDLELVMKWTGEPDRSFVFVGDFNGWDIANAPVMHFSQPSTSLSIGGVVDGPFEFKLCNDTSWDCWDWMVPSAWTLVGEPAAYAPSILADDNAQLRVDAVDGDDVRIVINVDTATITAIANPSDELEEGTVSIGIELKDPAPLMPLSIQCERSGDHLVCSHNGTFGVLATFAWYLNSAPLGGETAETLTLPAESLQPGYRIALIVTDPPLAQSAQLTLTEEIISGIIWTYVVNFEEATKNAYGSGTVNLSGLNWDMTEALIGNDDDDFRLGTKSARLRGYEASSMTMLDAKPSGLGMISFLYRRYGTDTQAEWAVEYTQDGATWNPIGDSFTAPATDDVQTFREEVNASGDIRVRVRCLSSGSSNRRLNIDDIKMSDFP